LPAGGGSGFRSGWEGAAPGEDPTVVPLLNVGSGANGTVEVLYRLYGILTLLWPAVPIHRSGP